MAETMYFLRHRQAGETSDSEWQTYHWDTGRSATTDAMRCHCVAAQLRLQGRDVWIWTNPGLNNGNIRLPAIDPSTLDPTENP